MPDTLNNQNNEIVYVLSNPAMEGLVKIGKTTQSDIANRMRQLYTTGVPLPFECEYACRVDDCSKVEKAFHLAFGNSRINSSREFFQIEPERVISILQLLSVEDVTPQVEDYLSEDVTIEEKASAKKMKSNRRPNMNFIEMGIPVGATLKYKEDDIQVTVAEEKKVNYNGNISSLTGVTREIMGLDYSVQPAPHWTYDGRALTDIYNETYVLEN
jgi:hypothetical protein